MDEDITVESWTRQADGHILGRVSWTGAPTLRFVVHLDQASGLVAFQVEAVPGEVVRARQVRQTPVGRMERFVRAAAAEGKRARRPYLSPQVETVDVTDGHPTSPERDRTRWRAWTADFVLRPRTGPGGRSDRPYAALAACYVDAFERGERSPVQAVAYELEFDETAVRNYLTKARERGLLTAPERGRAGGQLTARARHLLRGHARPDD